MVSFVNGKFDVGKIFVNKLILLFSKEQNSLSFQLNTTLICQRVLGGKKKIITSTKLICSTTFMKKNY